MAPKSESCELDANSLKSAKRDGGVEGRSFGRWRGLDPESVICPTRRVLAGLGAAKSFAPPVEFWPQKARADLKLRVAMSEWDSKSLCWPSWRGIDREKANN